MSENATKTAASTTEGSVAAASGEAHGEHGAPGPAAARPARPVSRSPGPSWERIGGKSAHSALHPELRNRIRFARLNGAHCTVNTVSTVHCV